MAVVTVAKSTTGPKLLSLKQRQYLIAFLFVAPALINFAIFRYIPYAEGDAISFRHSHGIPFLRKARANAGATEVP